MNIQIITDNEELVSEEKIVVSKYSKPIALDDFDINIVDLSYEKIWYNKGHEQGKLNNGNDLISITELVASTEKAITVYVCPQNIDYWYNYHYNGSQGKEVYNSSSKIRDLLNNSDSLRLLSKYIFDNASLASLKCESTKTILGDKNYDADFHFIKNTDNIAITHSNKSDKITTIRNKNNIYITTLNICISNENIKNFINNIFDKKINDEMPSWVKEYDFGNDKKERELINENTEKIAILQRNINDAEKQLELNNRYKSILFTNGNQLVDVVFEILQVILECDLSNFVDEKKEDFLIEKDEKIFIGEIKGVNTNVKNSHISQLDVHYQTYIEDMQDNILIDSVHPILIINPLRTIKLSERDTIHEKQIKLACDRGSLIIETVTLLKIFELYKENKLTTEHIIKVLSNKKGLLKIEDFD